MANVLCKIRRWTRKLLLRIYEPIKVHEHSDHQRYCIFWWLNLVVCFCWGNHCWFIFVLWRGYCSVSFQRFVWRHLVITPIHDTKKLLNVLYWLRTLRHDQLRKKLYTLRAKSKKIAHVTNFNKLFQLLNLTFHSVRPFLWNPNANASNCENLLQQSLAVC